MPIDPWLMDSAVWRRTMQGALSRMAGSGADAQAVADAAFFTWERMTLQLAPVIGEEGVRALYARSLHLTRLKFPWLAHADKSMRTDSPFIDLRVSLASRDPADGADAGAALFVTFTGLLIALIGVSLTSRLLAPVWADAEPDAPAQERHR